MSQFTLQNNFLIFHVYYRPPYSFIEDNSRTSEMAIERDKDKDEQRKPSEKQQQQQQQQQQPLHLPLFTLEHPFANHAFYDDEDYLENEASKEGQNGKILFGYTLHHAKFSLMNVVKLIHKMI